MYKKQVIVIVTVVIIMGVLYMLPIKGLIKTEAQGHANPATPQKQPVAVVTVDMVSAAAKIAVGSALAGQISKTESELKNARSDADKLSLQKSLQRSGMMSINLRRPLFIMRTSLKRKILLVTG